MDWAWLLRAGPIAGSLLGVANRRVPHPVVAAGDGAGPTRRDAGFTLLEVMVALAIALPALLLLYRQGALALEITGSALSTQNALSRAESHLAALQVSAAAPGDHEGDDGGGYRWRTRIVPLATAEPAHSVSGRSPYAGGTTLYAASVTISWHGGRGERSVVLETRLLGPALGALP